MLRPIFASLLGLCQSDVKKLLLEALTLLFQKGDPRSYLEGVLALPQGLDAIMVSLGVLNLTHDWSQLCLRSPGLVSHAASAMMAISKLCEDQDKTLFSNNTVLFGGLLKIIETSEESVQVTILGT